MLSVSKHVIPFFNNLLENETISRPAGKTAA